MHGTDLRKNKFALTLIAFVAPCIIFGCATMPRGMDGFPYSTISMHRVSYFALVDMCDKDGVKWDYDPLSQEIVLKKDKKEVRLLIGSAAVMVDGAVQRLDSPVELKDGVIYAPLAVREYFVAAQCKFPARNTMAGGVYLRPVETIVIDAGHGGKDPGAIGRYGLKEKGVVLDVAAKVKKELERCGFRVELTRSEDRFIRLTERPQVANAGKADLFVSIHANANKSRWIEGFEVYYLTEAVDDNARALAAAENAPLEMESVSFLDAKLLQSLKAIVWDMIYTENRKESIELAQYIGRAVSEKMNLKLLGVRGAPFAVLKGAKMPAVLVEIGYISNRDGEKKLRDPVYRNRMAEAIVSGISDFKNYCEGRK